MVKLRGGESVKKPDEGSDTLSYFSQQLRWLQATGDARTCRVFK